MQVRVTPSGILDQDTELIYVGKGNYIDANDIRHRQMDGANFGGVMGTEGNLNLITEVNGAPGTGLPTIGTQQKKYRIYLDYSKIASGYAANIGGVLYLEKSSGTISSFTVNIAPSSVADLALQLQTAFTNLHLAAFGSGAFTYDPSGVPHHTSTGTTTGYFTITTTADVDYVIKVKNDDPQNSLCSIVLENEYVATATTLKVIGSYQLEDYLFVWSASEAAANTPTSDYSEIGVVYTTTGGTSYSYKTLCRSRKLGFSKERRPDIQAERVGSQINFYWTDGFGKPRAMYLKYNLVTTQNGFMFTTGGRYELDTIDEETSFFYRVPSATIENLQVVASGGTITAGNKRYTGRFLTEDFVASEFLYPTNPVNIYAADPTQPSLVIGDIAGTATSKSVSMLVRNIPAGIYRYFELVVIEYSEEGFTSTIVQRYILGDNTTDLEVVHTKNGQDNIPLGANELLAIFEKYDTVKSMRIIDGRMTLTNLTREIDLDLSEWAKTIRHSLSSTTIQGFGPIVRNDYEFLDNAAHSDIPNEVVTNLKHGLSEYLDPQNTLLASGYMLNDTYRFGVQVKWKSSGRWSAPYYVDDIRFDTLADNIDPATSRRDSNSIVTNLTDVTGSLVYINFIRFNNVNLDYLIGGIHLRDLIEGFRFVRAERIPEVLATGYFFLGEYTSSSPKRTPYTPGILTGIAGGSVYTFDAVNIVGPSNTSINNGSPHGFVDGQTLNFFDAGPGSNTINLTDNFYYFARVISPNEFGLSVEPDGPLVTMTASGTNFTFRTGGVRRNHATGTLLNGSDVVFFHSPDNFYTGRNYVFNVSTCALKILGPTYVNKHFSVTTFPGNKNTSYSDLTGYFSSAPREYLEINSGTTVRLEDYAIMLAEQEEALPNTSLIALSKERYDVEVFGLDSLLRPSVGSNFPSGLSNSEESGVYYGQLFKDLGAGQKYPINVENTVYHSTGHVYYLQPGQNGTISNIDVFGGDVFTQKTYLPIGKGQIIGCYTQNVANTQMFNRVEEPLLGYRWPQYNGVGTATTYELRVSGLYDRLVYSSWNGSIWLKLSTTFSDTPLQSFYDKSYNLRDGSLVQQGYLKDEFYDGSSPTRITWSAGRVTGSRLDRYRTGYGPSEFVDLDITDGPIVHHEVVGGSMYTFQEFSFQRQYFRDASLIGADAGTDVLIGSGSILAAPGVELSSIGSEHKWSIIKGVNPSGKDTLYWFNNRLRKIVRFAGDGVVVLSDRGMISTLQNKTSWLSGRIHPLTGSGVHGVWNDKYGEALFTLKAINPTIQAWTTAQSYTAGTYIFISPANTYLHASGLPFAYKCKTNHTSAAANKPETGANWQTFWTKITPGTDPLAHTLMTLVYDELKNGFICMHSYWPDIYLQYQNRFFSPDPRNPTLIYLHDSNDNQQYYGVDYDPSLTMVMNYEPNQPKIFDAVQMQTERVPFTTRFYTPNHESFLDETEWELREGLWYSPIKNDTLTALGGGNNLDTSRLWGRWLKIKFFFESSTGKQKLLNAIVRFRASTQLYNQ